MNRLAVITSLLILWGLVFSRVSATQEAPKTAASSSVQKLSK